MTSRSSTARSFAALATCALLAACRGASTGGASSPYGAKVTPVAGLCGQRAAVAVSRARAPGASGRSTRQLTGPGALVVQLAPADSGLTLPEGPVRLLAAADSAAGATSQSLTATGSGTLRSGPLAAGRYVVAATGTGYQPSRLTVVVRPGLTDTVRFRLAARCVRRG